ncbi:MAG: KpsF/GutQ family sugar-phosphate isomerase [Ignavibacteriales bacterium]|nr:KpsF/GutQ family sugar-phosphate isomerase [Ignavibacteriales bacterium]
MSTDSKDIQKAKEVIRMEADAVSALENKINASFQNAVDVIFKCKGRVIITGMGKSGIIARKIVATMNSTGTPAIFLHPSDAVHGDLGMVRDDDVVICISKSGDTQEIRELLPMFKRIGVPIISMVGRLNSNLGLQSDIVLDISVKEEACPHNLAPTTSTTATLAMGDALAVTLLEKKNFSANDFAMFHPGGNLGKRLLLKIEELAITGTQIPKIGLQASLKDAILEITAKRLGATCVLNDDGTLAGIITDGDLRRLLQKTSDVSGLTAEQVMTKNPKTIRKGTLASAALQEMETFSITQLVIVDDYKKPYGLVHLHDLVRAGLGGDSSA